MLQMRAAWVTHYTGDLVSVYQIPTVFQELYYAVYTVTKIDMVSTLKGLTV